MRNLLVLAALCVSTLYASRPGFIHYGTSFDYAVVGDDGTTPQTDDTGRPYIKQGDHKVFYTHSNPTFTVEDGATLIELRGKYYITTFCSDTAKVRPVTKSTTYAIFPTQKP